MYYYSIFYKTNPSTLLLDVDGKVKGKNYETGFLFGHQNKLTDAGIKAVLESHLKNSKIDYTELIITESEEITEQDYLGRTQYS
jgi:hypothetical protein